MIFTATSDGRIDIAGREAACVLGRSGVLPAADKREGDGASPLGVWPLRRVLYRPDREAPPATGLPVAALKPDDGWCDAPGDPAYNRPVRLPYPASAEQMWREDRVYDLVVILGHNDDPPVSPMGSAIFLHLIQPDGAPHARFVATPQRANPEPRSRAATGGGEAAEAHTGILEPAIEQHQGTGMGCGDGFDRFIVWRTGGHQQQQIIRGPGGRPPLPVAQAVAAISQGRGIPLGQGRGTGIGKEQAAGAAALREGRLQTQGHRGQAQPLEAQLHGPAAGAIGGQGRSEGRHQLLLGAGEVGGKGHGGSAAGRVGSREASSAGRGARAASVP